MPATCTSLLIIGLLLVRASMVSAQTASGDRAEVPLDKPQTVKIDSGDTLYIKGVLADIDVVRSKTANAVITVTRAGTAAEPRIELVTHDGGAILCTMYASSNPKKQNECLANGRGTLDNDVKKDSSVRFRVELPEGARFVGDVRTGNIKYTAGPNDLVLETLYGDITFVDNGSPSVRGRIGLKGTLTAFVSPDPRSRRLSLDVANGELRVAVPTTVTIGYRISTDRAIKTPFTLTKADGVYWSGTSGPKGSPNISMVLNTGSMLAQITIVPRTDLK